MHESESRAGSNVEIDASRMRDELTERLWLNAQLHEALNRNEYELWYQPAVLTTGLEDKPRSHHFMSAVPITYLHNSAVSGFGSTPRNTP